MDGIRRPLYMLYQNNGRYPLLRRSVMGVLCILLLALAGCGDAPYTESNENMATVPSLHALYEDAEDVCFYHSHVESEQMQSTEARGMAAMDHTLTPGVMPDMAVTAAEAADAEVAILHIPDEAELQAMREAEEQAAEAARREAERQAAEEAARQAAKEREAALHAATPGFSYEFADKLTKEEQAEARALYEEGFVFYRQSWSPLKELSYSGDTFGQSGCGPTCVAEIISNLAGIPVTPEEMREYAIEHHYSVMGGGTAYAFMTDVPEQYGIKVSQLWYKDEAGVRKALSEGKLILATMGPGDFTLGAHFMLFRGITEDGKILISDSYSYEHTVMEWDYEDLYKQLKKGYWVYEPAAPVEDAETTVAEP